MGSEQATAAAVTINAVFVLPGAGRELVKGHRQWMRGETPALANLAGGCCVHRTLTLIHRNESVCELARVHRARQTSFKKGLVPLPVLAASDLTRDAPLPQLMRSQYIPPAHAGALQSREMLSGQAMWQDT